MELKTKAWSISKGEWEYDYMLSEDGEPLIQIWDSVDGTLDLKLVPYTQFKDDNNKELYLYDRVSARDKHTGEINTFLIKSEDGFIVFGNINAYNFFKDYESIKYLETDYTALKQSILV